MNKTSGRKGRRPWWIFSCAALRRSEQVNRILLVLGALTAAGWAAPAMGGDLSLSDAIDLALAHSSRVASARHDSAAASFSLRAAGALRFPQLTLTAQTTFKNEIPSLVIDIPPISIARHIGSKDIYQTDLELTQPIFTGGRLADDIRAERERGLAQSSGLRAAEMAAAYECRTSYLEGMRTAALLAGARASLKRVEIISKDVENLFRVGMADSIDILDSEMALENARQAVADRAVAHEVSITRLRSLTGIDSSRSLSLTEEVRRPGTRPLPDTPGQIRRPELERLEHLARAADFATSSIRAGCLPSLTGFASYSLGKPNQDLFEDRWNTYAMVGLRLRWGLSLAGRTGRLSDEAMERAGAARAVRDDLLDGLEAARSTALERMAHASESVERSGTQLDLANRKFGLARDRQRNGTLSVNRLLEMEAELTTINVQYQTAVIGYYVAEADYLYAVGSRGIFGGLQ